MTDTPEPLILASRSPRRQELLAEAGYTFSVIAPDPCVEESGTPSRCAAELVTHLAYRKARDVADRVCRGVVIGCDTVVECCGQILGKPRNRGHARQILHLLRGREHRVYSGLCLIRQPQNTVLVDVAVSVLFMQQISDGLIERYLDTELWQGKAGAFGLQDRLGWIEVRMGSLSNVVGLPMELLAEMLQRIGYRRGAPVPA